MKRFLSVLSGLAIVAAATTAANAQVGWAIGAPGGTSGGSLEFTPGVGVLLDTGIPAAQVGGDRGNAAAMPPVPSTASDYTITAWINTRGDNGFGEATDNSWWLGTGNQGIHLGIFDTSKLRSGHWGSDISGTSIVPANTWVHVAYAYDADGGTVDAVTGVQNGAVEIFFNGVSEGAPQDQLAPNNSTTNLILGTRDNGGGPGWDGFIDDVAVFTSVLSAGDINTLAGDSSQAIALGAAAYYDFEDDQTGTTAANAGTLGTDLSGITGELPPAPPAASWVSGAPGGSPGGAASFAGGNMEFLQTDIPAMTLGIRGSEVDYTVSAWINSAVDNGLGEAADNLWWFGTGDQGVHFGIFDTSKLRSGHWGADVSGTSIVPANTWVHATYVYDADGGTVDPTTGLATGASTIYLNGVAEGPAQDQVGPNRANTDLIIGSRSNGRESWNGIVDDVAIFTSALSAADVATLAADTTQAVALGAVTYYDFEDDQTGTTVANSGSLGSALDGMIPVGVGPVLKGDVDRDGGVTFLDINPFILVLSSNGFQLEADCDCDGDVDFLDIQPFINILAGQP